ncbi:MAG: hypothetical protein IIC12_06200, partial [Proteobacteria bacterium]|nr:hypothetical protein [Pseudomonadota bacterium]
MNNDFCQECRCKPCKCDDPNKEFYTGEDQTKETDYDRIMKLGEDEYLRLKKENDPYAFHRAVEMVTKGLGLTGEIIRKENKNMNVLLTFTLKDDFWGFGQIIDEGFTGEDLEKEIRNLIKEDFGSLLDMYDNEIFLSDDQP